MMYNVCICVYVFINIYILYHEYDMIIYSGNTVFGDKKPNCIILHDIYVVYIFTSYVYQLINTYIHKPIRKYAFILIYIQIIPSLGIRNLTASYLTKYMWFTSLHLMHINLLIPTYINLYTNVYAYLYVFREYGVWG
jgi:hypothetical protein